MLQIKLNYNILSAHINSYFYKINQKSKAMLPKVSNMCTIYLNILLIKTTTYILKKMEGQRLHINLKLR